MNSIEASMKEDVKTGVLVNLKNGRRFETDADGNYLVTAGKIVHYRGRSWTQALMVYRYRSDNGR